MGFQHRADAERFLKIWERAAKFGLELQPDKTRLIEFGRFAAYERRKQGEGKPETFTSRVHALLWDEHDRPFHGLAAHGGEADEGKADSH